MSGEHILINILISHSSGLDTVLAHNNDPITPSRKYTTPSFFGYWWIYSSRVHLGQHHRHQSTVELYKYISTYVGVHITQKLVDLENINIWETQTFLSIKLL